MRVCVYIRYMSFPSYGTFGPYDWADSYMEYVHRLEFILPFSFKALSYHRYACFPKLVSLRPIGNALAP